MWGLCAPVSRSTAPAGPARCPVSAGSRHPAPVRGPTGAVRSSRGHRRVGTEAGVLQQRARPRTQASPRSRGPGRPLDVRCISPASSPRRAVSVQERSPLGVEVPRAAPAWQGWGLMLSGSEQLGTLKRDRAPRPTLQSRVKAPWPAACCVPPVLSEAPNANPGSLTRCLCELRPTRPQPEPQFLICWKVS